MRHNFLAVFLVSSLSSTMAFAESSPAPCNLMDQDALIALKLGEHKTKVEQKKVEQKSAPGTSGLPPISLDVCTFSPREAILPSLTITTAAATKDTKMAGFSCNDQSMPGFEITVCAGTAGGSVITLTLMTESSSGASIKKALRSQVERLDKRLARSSSQ